MEFPAAKELESDFPYDSAFPVRSRELFWVGKKRT